MATWPSASKASTTNLDSGTDSPASARADLKTNVDNVNSIIDMFNITSPADNQILQYSSANSRFEMATPSSGGGACLYAFGAGGNSGSVAHGSYFSDFDIRKDYTTDYSMVNFTGGDRGFVFKSAGLYRMDATMWQGWSNGTGTYLALRNNTQGNFVSWTNGSELYWVHPTSAPTTPRFDAQGNDHRNFEITSTTDQYQWVVRNSSGSTRTIYAQGALMLYRQA